MSLESFFFFERFLFLRVSVFFFNPFSLPVFSFYDFRVPFLHVDLFFFFGWICGSLNKHSIRSFSSYLLHLFFFSRGISATPLAYVPQIFLCYLSLSFVSSGNDLLLFIYIRKNDRYEKERDYACLLDFICFTFLSICMQLAQL